MTVVGGAVVVGGAGVVVVDGNGVVVVEVGTCVVGSSVTGANSQSSTL